MTKVPKPEYWVFRVMLHQGKPAQLDLMTPGAFAAAHAALIVGKLVMLGDGCICEPVEVFDHEALAREHKAQLARDYPSEDFRVILNADVTV